ncbi:response regulator, partial [Candidatus Saccharibacteria bacterium]|nr:response regulator [Candidatus Saccharibacteria bacterium]
MNFNNSIQEASKNVKGFSTNEETILVVDDSRQLVNFLADSILASLGYRSMKAFNGKTALNIIRNHQSEICLMLLDLEMPDMTGLELLRKARAAGYDVPAIMITARGSEQIAVDAFRLGVHDYLT